MSSNVQGDNAYLKRLLERAQEIPVNREAYDLTWRIEQRAAEMFQHDYPTGKMSARLPQFRNSYPDPIGDHYRRQALAEIRTEDAEQASPRMRM